MRSRFFRLMPAILATIVLAACATEESSTDVSHHFGEIHVPCSAFTADTCSVPCPRDSKSTCVITDYLDEIEKTCKTVETTCEAGDQLLNLLFGETRHNKFANFIVYFDQDHTPGRFKQHQPILIWNRNNTRHLYGVQEVYILVFTQSKACFSATGTTLAKAEPNPFEMVLNILGKGGTTSNQTTLATKPATFIWYPLSGAASTPGMWLAVASVPVDTNSADWITIRYAPRRPQSKNEDVPEECVAAAADQPYSGDFLAYNAFFSDSRESHVGVAVAFGGTRNAIGPKPADGSNSASPYLNGYALAKFYMIRPTLVSNRNNTGGSVKYRPSIAIAVGTNITNSPLSELLVGVSVGHVIGSVGAIAGINYLPVNETTSVKSTSSTRRRGRPFVGIDYSF